MGKLKSGEDIEYLNKNGVIFGKYKNGEEFIVGGDPYELSKISSLYLTQIEFDKIQKLKEENYSVEAIFRKFTKEIRNYIN